MMVTRTTMITDDDDDGDDLRVAWSRSAFHDFKK